MKRVRGLRARLLMTYLLLMLFALGIFVFRYGWLSQDSLVEELEHEQELRAYVLSNALEEPMQEYIEGETSPDALKALVERLAASVQGRLTLLDRRGNPTYDTHVDAATIPNQLDQVEVQAALARSEQHDIRIDPLVGEELLYVAAPIEHEEELYGVVQLTIPTKTMWARINQAWLSLLGTALAVIAGAILVSLWLARGILEPVHDLQRAAGRMASGDLDQRISFTRRDELGELGEAFNAMAGRLQRLIVQQEDFVANASHELRTPLTTIKLRVEALLGGARHDPAIADRFLHEIESEVDRLSRLTDDLLTLSQVEVSAETLRMERLNLPDLLYQSIAAFRPRAEAAQITLAMDVGPGPPTVHASPSQIRQVIDNLLDNALKHSSGGDVVTVSCRPVNGQVAVFVTDTGQGIPARDLPYVFDRFYRVDKSRSRVGHSNGTGGLGLSIVRSVVTAHGGQVSIDSQEGKGTTVRFTLPVYGKT